MLRVGSRAQAGAANTTAMRPRRIRHKIGKAYTVLAKFARSEPSGVGGWLLLLIAKLWFSAAVRILGGLSAGASALGMTNASGTDVIAEMGLSAANVLAGILAGVAGYLLMRKNAKGPIATGWLRAAFLPRLGRKIQRPSWKPLRGLTQGSSSVCPIASTPAYNSGNGRALPLPP